MISDEKLYEFVESRVKGLDPHLYKVERETHLKALQSHMISGPLQGAFLKMIVRLLNAKNILEIGTYTGYASLAMAEGCSDDAKITTIECDEEIAETARNNFQESEFNNRINLVIGDAVELLPNMLKENNYDLVFIDADKTSNKFYYDELLKTQKSGLVIIVDNVLWKGRVLDERVNDVKTQSIKEFIAYVSCDDRCESFILPFRDGLYIIRKK